MKWMDWTGTTSDVTARHLSATVFNTSTADDLKKYASALRIQQMREYGYTDAMVEIKMKFKKIPDADRRLDMANDQLHRFLIGWEVAHCRLVPIARSTFKWVSPFEEANLVSGFFIPLVQSLHPPSTTKVSLFFFRLSCVFFLCLIYFFLGGGGIAIMCLDINGCRTT